MTEIKICGITRLEDALCATVCGADALGFIFYRKSQRYIAPIMARKIMAVLPESVARVGVFVNQGVEEIEEIVSGCRLDFVQLHGDESPDYCRRFSPSMVIKAVNIQQPGDLEELMRYDVKAFLVDSRDGGLYGGTGKKADWKLAAELARVRPIVLAGGLNEDNILEALTEVSPAAVDINSGVEERAGIKDHEKVRRIIGVVRAHRASGQNHAGIFKVRP